MSRHLKQQTFAEVRYRLRERVIGAHRLATSGPRRHRTYHRGRCEAFIVALLIAANVEPSDDNVAGILVQLDEGTFK